MQTGACSLVGVYSYRGASIGRRRAARIAGYTPKNTPIAAETPIRRLLRERRVDGPVSASWLGPWRLRRVQPSDLPPR
jgi:hypothetical protein